MVPVNLLDLEELLENPQEVPVRIPEDHKEHAFSRKMGCTTLRIIFGRNFCIL